MMRDRHAVLRIATQALVPVLLLAGAVSLARMGQGLGGPAAAGLIVAAALALYALVFGFSALARALPPLAMRLLAGLALALLLGASLIGPQDLEAWLGSAASPLRLRHALAEAAGAALALLVTCALAAMLQAIGARARPLEREE